MIRLVIVLTERLYRLINALDSKCQYLNKQLDVSVRNYIIFYIIYNKKSMHLNDRMISVFISFLILLLKKTGFYVLK